MNEVKTMILKKLDQEHLEQVAMDTELKGIQTRYGFFTRKELCEYLNVPFEW